MIEYIPCGDYFIPDLKLRKTPPIGKYGRMRKRYLEEHKPFLYNKLVLSESLFPHLLEIEAAANRRIEEILPALMKDAGVTESLKAADPMKWVGLMNTCHCTAPVKTDSCLDRGRNRARRIDLQLTIKAKSPGRFVFPGDSTLSRFTTWGSPSPAAS